MISERLTDEENCNINASKCYAVAPSQGTSCQYQTDLVGGSRLNGSNVTKLQPVAVPSLRGWRCATLARISASLCHVNDGAGAVQISLAGFILNMPGVYLALK